MTQQHIIVRLRRRAVLVLAVVMLTAASAGAQTMPWEQPLARVATSVSGPVAASGVIIAIVIFGLMWLAGYSIIGAGLGILIGGSIIAHASDIASLLGF